MVGTIETTVRKFIAESFMYRESVASLTNDESLLDKGLIDSTGVLELVFFLEKTFSIKVDDDEVLPENLDSISRIAQFVMSKRQPAAKSCVA